MSVVYVFAYGGVGVSDGWLLVAWCLFVNSRKTRWWFYSHLLENGKQKWQNDANSCCANHDFKSHQTQKNIHQVRLQGCEEFQSDKPIWFIVQVTIVKVPRNWLGAAHLYRRDDQYKLALISFKQTRQQQKIEMNIPGTREHELYLKTSVKWWVVFKNPEDAF